MGGGGSRNGTRAAPLGLGTMMDRRFPGWRSSLAYPGLSTDRPSAFGCCFKFQVSSFKFQVSALSLPACCPGSPKSRALRKSGAHFVPVGSQAESRLANSSQSLPHFTTIVCPRPRGRIASHSNPTGIRCRPLSYGQPITNETTVPSPMNPRTQSKGRFKRQQRSRCHSQPHPQTQRFPPRHRMPGPTPGSAGRASLPQVGEFRATSSKFPYPTSATIEKRSLGEWPSGKPDRFRIRPGSQSNPR